ncbi:hypothetical protein VTN77DRAFT_4268 [Rasamsonia byssochlamydoides]|uniref:uncharacterized protein n=1 Tax=Rasamsonia byssochlamydoides TaxID=89139 RepID=UPI0037433586
MAAGALAVGAWNRRARSIELVRSGGEGANWGCWTRQDRAHMALGVVRVLVNWTQGSSWPTALEMWGDSLSAPSILDQLVMNSIRYAMCFSPVLAGYFDYLQPVMALLVADRRGQGRLVNSVLRCSRGTRHDLH